MNLDDFEQRLARTPLRAPPADWRQEILAAARESSPAHPAPAAQPRPTATAVPWLALLRRLAALPAPWAVPVAAVALVAALGGMAARVEAQLAPSPGLAPPAPSWASLLTAARRREASIAELANTETLDPAPGQTRGGPTDASQDRPRSGLEPGRMPRAREAWTFPMVA